MGNKGVYYITINRQYFRQCFQSIAYFVVFYDLGFFPLNIKQLFHGGLVNSQNYCPEVTRMTMVDYCPRPKAKGNSPPGHPRHRGAVVLTIHQTSMK